jgi:hypothetical protein
MMRCSPKRLDFTKGFHNAMNFLSSYIGRYVQTKQKRKSYVSILFTYEIINVLNETIINRSFIIGYN